MPLLQIFLFSNLQTPLPGLDQSAKTFPSPYNSMLILKQVFFPFKLDEQSIFNVPFIGKISSFTVFQGYLIFQTNPFLNQALNLASFIS